MKSNIENILGLVSAQIVNSTVPALIEKYDFFNKFNNTGSGNLDFLANSFKFDKRVFEAVLNYLVKEGYLDKKQSNKEPVYELSKTSKQFLIKNSNYDFSIYTTLFNQSAPKKSIDSIIYSLETGEPADWNDKGNWENQMKNGSLSKIFSQGMMSRGNYLRDYLSASLKNVLSKSNNLIDVGGSLGDYCGKFTGDHKNINCTVFDFPEVIKVAKENVLNKKYSRVSFVEGNMFKDQFPNDFDAFLFSNAIHDWDRGQIKQLFKKTFDAINKEGVIIIHDCHLDKNKTSPGYAVDHALYLSIFTDGTYYSHDEMKDLLNEAGFKKIKIIKTVAGFSAVLGYKV
jgi:3-hydroxy-5-methyl-1-naphthoate 3-O-methyltransferase